MLNLTQLYAIFENLAGDELQWAPDVNSYQILNDFVSTKGAESPLESNGE